MTMNIEGLKTLSDGMIVEELIGIIKKVYEFKPANPTDQFPIAKQGIVLKDDSGEIWVNIKNHKEYPKESEGCKVKLSSYFDKDKKTWFGVKKNSYEKDGKKHIVLDITKTGKIEQLHEEAPEDTPELPEETTGTKKDEAKSEPVKPTNWDAKERRDLRARMYNSALLTIYPVMAKAVIADGQKYTRQEILDEIEVFAKKGFNFVYESDEEIMF